MLKRLTVWAIMLALALCPWTYAEDEDAGIDISGWAYAQEAADVQQEWAALYGVTLDTFDTAENITKKCKFKVSEGKRDRLTNGRVGSPWTYDHSEAWVGVQLPEDVTPGAIRVEWMFDPQGFELAQYDADMNPLRTYTQADVFPSIYTVFPLEAETRTIRLNMTARDQGISNLAVYSAGMLPADVQTWLPPVEKADMMVFSTHQDDEVIFLGGTIPYSDVVCNRPTITIYMTNCSRDRRREALECLWEMGSRHYPEFINLKDEKVSSIEKGVKLWGGQENILKEMVARIRRYKPEVIVTQDLDGEYGHNQHKIMARAMQPAIEAAADPNQFPDSYNEYGAWQVKKLYLHLYKENQLRMDWTSPQDAFNGESLLEVARRGMEKHASQTKYYKVKDGGEYDNALYGLALTTVGEDVQKNDFFENIPLSGAEESGDAWEDAPAEETGDAWEDAPDEAAGDAWESAPAAAADDSWESAEIVPADEAAQAEYAVPSDDGVSEDVFAPAAAPQPVEETARETGGGHGGLVIALAAAALAVGGGAWVVLNRQTQAKKKRRKGKQKKGSAAKAKRKPAARASEKSSIKASSKSAPKASAKHASGAAAKPAGKHSAKN